MTKKNINSVTDFPGSTAAFVRCMLALALLLCGNNQSISQIYKMRKEAPVKSNLNIELGGHGLGVLNSLRLSKKVIIETGAGVGGGYRFDFSNGNRIVEYHIKAADPAFYFIVNPKIFYNRRMREYLKKSIKYNSGNFVGLSCKYTSTELFSSPTLDESIFVTARWGIQRVLAGRFIYNTHVGTGYVFSLENDDSIGLISINFKISYVIKEY